MNKQEQQAFQKDLFISLLLHLICIGVFFYGLPSIFKTVLEEQQVITFEMLALSDITNIRDQSIQTPEPQEINKSQKIEKFTSSPKKTLEQKEENQKQEEVKPLQKEPDIIKKEKTTLSREAEIVPEKKKEESRSVEKNFNTIQEIDKNNSDQINKKVKQVQPKTKEIDVKSLKKQEEDIIGSLLANLEKESEGTALSAPNRTPPRLPNEGNFTKGNNSDEESPLSITEEMLIKQQIIKHWDKPAGIEGIEVTFHVRLDIEGNVTIIQVSGLIGDTQLQVLVEETARRAVKKASPIQNLRPERYNVWKEFKLRFDPSSMM